MATQNAAFDYSGYILKIVKVEEGQDIFNNEQWETFYSVEYRKRVGENTIYSIVVGVADTYQEAKEIYFKEVDMPRYSN